VRDWTASGNASGLPYDVLRELSVRWVWELRASEYVAHARRVALEANAPLRESVAALQAERVAYARDLVRLLRSEIAKLADAAEKSPAQTLDPKVVARFVAVTAPELVALERNAQGLPADSSAADAATDWGKLSAEELEQWRRLREKAKRGGGDAPTGTG
jgi:hypothetical protein